MIYREIDGKLVLIFQPDHGRQCGAFASAWRDTAPLPQEVVAAAARHDDGWAEWEASPGIDPASGRPFAFFRTPVPDHLALFEHGVALAESAGALAATLVSMHAVGLYNGRYGLQAEFPPRSLNDQEQPLVESFYVSQQALQARLAPVALEASGAAASEFEERRWQWYRLLQFWDQLSLEFLSVGAKDRTYPGVPWAGALAEITLTALTPWDVLLEPYPFGDAPLVTTVPATIIERRRYESAADFRQALQRAERLDLVCTVRPG